MHYRVNAVYRDGVFVPATQCDLPERTEVELTVQVRGVVAAAVSDPEERARLLRKIAVRMQGNPIPKEAPRYRREEMHERR